MPPEHQNPKEAYGSDRLFETELLKQIASILVEEALLRPEEQLRLLRLLEADGPI